MNQNTASVSIHEQVYKDLRMKKLPSLHSNRSDVLLSSDMEGSSNHTISINVLEGSFDANKIQVSDDKKQAILSKIKGKNYVEYEKMLDRTVNKAMVRMRDS